MFENVEVHPTPEKTYLVPPPKDIDLGEWSIFWCLVDLKEKGIPACALTNDKEARKLFQRQGFLPCQRLVPPDSGIGGTLGILRHLVETGEIAASHAEEILRAMIAAGSHFPRGALAWILSTDSDL